MIDTLIHRLRIRMVERYLAGRMPDRESRRFHQRLEADPRLRQLLQEEKTIEKALLHDRDSIPVMGTQRLERMLKGQASGGTPSYRAAGGDRGIWPSPDISRLQRLAEWLTRREALVAISAIGSVGVALVIYSLGDSRGKLLETPGTSPPSSAALPSSAAPDTAPMMTIGIVPEHDSLAHTPEADSTVALAASHDTAPGGPRFVTEPAARADSAKWIREVLRSEDVSIDGPVVDSLPVRVNSKSINEVPANGSHMRRAMVPPLDSADLRRIYLEQQARRMGRKADSSDTVHLNPYMNDK